jgi:hypothetical protein
MSWLVRAKTKTAQMNEASEIIHMVLNRSVDAAQAAERLKLMVSNQEAGVCDILMTELQVATEARHPETRALQAVFDEVCNEAQQTPDQGMMPMQGQPETNPETGPIQEM